MIGKDFILREALRFPMDGKIDVFNLEGQSNAEGQGVPHRITADRMVEYAEKCFRFNSTGVPNGGVAAGDWGPLQIGVNSDGLASTGTDFGVETAISAAYYANYLKPCYWIKSGFGGWGVDEVLKTSGSFHPNYDAGSGHLNITSPPNAGVARLGTQYGILPSDCRFHWIWIQGETDANYSPDDSEYGANFGTVYADKIAALTFTFDSQTAVHVNTRFSTLPSGGITLVNSAIDSWASEDTAKRRVYTPMEKDSISHDQIHYDADGLVNLGMQLFETIFSG